MPVHPETVLMLKALLGLRLAIGRRLPFLQTFSDRGNSQPDHLLRHSGSIWHAGQAFDAPGTRHLSRLKENAGTVDIHLSKEELWSIDTELDSMEMSDAFGGSTIKQ